MTITSYHEEMGKKLSTRSRTRKPIVTKNSILQYGVPLFIGCAAGVMNHQPLGVTPLLVATSAFTLMMIALYMQVFDKSIAMRRNQPITTALEIRFVNSLRESIARNATVGITLIGALAAMCLFEVTTMFHLDDVVTAMTTAAFCYVTVTTIMIVKRLETLHRILLP